MSFLGQEAFKMPSFSGKQRLLGVWFLSLTVYLGTVVEFENDEELLSIILWPGGLVSYQAELSYFLPIIK